MYPGDANAPEWLPPSALSGYTIERSVYAGRLQAEQVPNGINHFASDL
jgi:hypothetical protein